MFYEPWVWDWEALGKINSGGWGVHWRNGLGVTVVLLVVFVDFVAHIVTLLWQSATRWRAVEKTVCAFQSAMHNLSKFTSMSYDFNVQVLSNMWFQQLLGFRNVFCCKRCQLWWVYAFCVFSLSPLSISLSVTGLRGRHQSAVERIVKKKCEADKKCPSTFLLFFYSVTLCYPLVLHLSWLFLKYLLFYLDLCQASGMHCLA